MDSLPDEKARQRDPMTRHLVLLVLLVGFIGFAWKMARPLLLNEDPYDFDTYYMAAYAAGHGVDPYDLEALEVLAAEIGVPRVILYTYPPFFTLLILPLGYMPYQTAMVIWHLANLLMVALSIWLTARALSLQLNATHALVVGLSFFVFDPIVYNVNIGQVNLVILLLLAGTAWAWVRQREALAGVALGLAVSIKVAPIVLLAYFLWKRGIRLVIAAIVTIVACAAIGYLALGAQATIQFIPILTEFASEVDPWIANQSLAGFLGRIFIGDQYVSPLTYNPGLAAGLRYAIGAVLIGVAGVVLIRSRRKDVFHLEFSLVLILFALVNSTTWVHHLVWLVYPFIALALACVRRQNIKATIVFCLGFALVAFPLGYREAVLFQWPQSLWISSTFYGLMILYGLNAWLIHTAEERPAIQETSAPLAGA